MQLTFNNFKQVVDRSSEKIFNRVAEAIATSDNAALVAMFDDKLILLDEEKDTLHLCDYLLESGVLTMHKFESVNLTENDSKYIDEVVDRYFDIDDDSTISVKDLMNGFRLKYKNESRNIFTEAKDRKYRKIVESSRICAIKKARETRDVFSEDIKTLLEEPFMKNLTLKVTNSKDSIPTALNKVAFKNPYPITVNTDIGGPAKELVTLRDNTNVMDAMKGLALKVSEKWKSDSFRKKFEKMINSIVQTESVELAKTSVLSFLDENKELFLLKEELFNELITKTTLMLEEADTDSVIKIFEGIIESPRGRKMKAEYFHRYKIDEEKLNKINNLTEEEDDVMQPEEEPSKAAGNDLEEEDVNKIIDIFKKIKSSLSQDTAEMDYVEDKLSSLEDLKTTGLEDSKVKDIIDFLNAAGSSKIKPKDDEEEEEIAPQEEIDL